MISSRSVSSAPAEYRFPREVIAVEARRYLRYGLTYRGLNELLCERRIGVDHVTIYRWVQTFTPEFIDAARPARHATGDRWLSTRRMSRSPVDVTTDRAPVYPRVLDELVPAPRHLVEQYANKPGGVRLRLPQGEASAGAWHQDDQVAAHDRGRSSVRAEPSPRTLRTHGRLVRS